MKVAVYSGTRNLYKDFLPAIKSLIINSDVDKIHLLIEDDEFIEPLPDFVEITNVSGQTYFPESCPNRATVLTYMCLLRTAYHRIFPQYDKILQLDADTIVDKNVSDLWDYDISDYYLAMAKEPKCSKGGQYYKRDNYYNMGVCLMNLEKLRDGTGDKAMAILNKRVVPVLDQDVFNEVCEGHILEIPADYNVSDWTGHSDNPKIIHYAAMRKWNHMPHYLKYADIPWDEVLRQRNKGLWLGI